MIAHLIETLQQVEIDLQSRSGLRGTVNNPGGNGSEL